jgi:hypothetical protein
MSADRQRITFFDDRHVPDMAKLPSVWRSVVALTAPIDGGHAALPSSQPTVEGNVTTLEEHRSIADGFAADVARYVEASHIFQQWKVRVCDAAIVGQVPPSLTAMVRFNPPPPPPPPVRRGRLSHVQQAHQRQPEPGGVSISIVAPRAVASAVIHRGATESDSTVAVDADDAAVTAKLLTVLDILLLSDNGVLYRAPTTNEMLAAAATSALARSAAMAIDRRPPPSLVGNANAYMATAAADESATKKRRIEQSIARPLPPVIGVREVRCHGDSFVAKLMEMCNTNAAFGA